MILLAFEQEIATGVLTPLDALFKSVIINIPGIIAALIIILAGYIIGILIGFLVGKIVEKFKVDKWIESTGRIDALGGLTLSGIVARLVKWWVFIAFLIPAAGQLKVPELSSSLIKLAEWVPQLILGIVIMIIGLLFADFLADAAAQAKKLKGIRAVSSLIRVATIIFFANIALRQIGIEIQFAENVLLIIIGGIVLSLALAIGIGFGFGLKKHADGIIKDLRKNLK